MTAVMTISRNEFDPGGGRQRDAGDVSAACLRLQAEMLEWCRPVTCGM